MADNRVPQADESTLEATHAECNECDELYDIDDLGVDGREFICPEDSGHALEFIAATITPYGYSDDDQYYHHGRKEYEYPAPAPE